MNHTAVGRKYRAVTGAVPGSVGVIPSQRTAFVRARSRDSVGRTIVLLPDGDLSLAKIHDSAATWLDVVEAVHQ